MPHFLKDFDPDMKIKALLDEFKAKHETLAADFDAVKDKLAELTTEHETLKATVASKSTPAPEPPQPEAKPG